MGSADGASWNNKRPDGEAVIFHLCGNGVETEANVSANILGNDPAGACFSNDSVHFRPEVARIGFPELLACGTEGLAGIASANNVNCSGVLLAVELADVVVDWDVWPVPLEHPSAVGLDFAEGDGSHPSPFEAETEAADPRKEVEDVESGCTG
jgi:hypothetical protein